MSRYMFGIVVGSASLVAGCAIGLMVAPASGAEIRRRLAWRFDEERYALARKVERVKTKLEQPYAGRETTTQSAA